MPQSSRQAGISMVEVSTVLVIMGITLAASIPAFHHLMQSNNLQNATEQLAGHLRLARQMAVARGVPHIAAWNPATESYGLITDENGNGLPDDGEASQGPYTLPLRISLQNSPTQPFSSNLVVFTPTGSASETGGVVLSDDRGNTREVTVMAPTGQVRLD